MISNLTTSHSVGSNCEQDDCYGVLASLKGLLTLDELEPNETDTTFVQQNQASSSLTNTFSYTSQKSNMYSSEIQKNTTSYATGWIIKKIKPCLNICMICIYKLIFDTFLKNIVS